MGITVRDVLKLEIFKNSKVLAGHKGLDRVINRVSVFDCPIQIDRDKIVLKEGDFFISNFFPFKDDEDYALYSLNFINSCGCSCFCITNEYLDSFTEKLISAWDDINLPIVTIDYTTSYGDIMNAIMSLILERQRDTIMEMKISALLENNLPLNEIHSTLNYINYYFLKYVTAIYCCSSDLDYKFDKNLIDLLSKNRSNICIPYKKGLLILITYNDTNKSELSKTINFYINQLKENVLNYIVGVSDNNIPIVECKNAVNQALLSSRSYHLATNSVVSYTSLGIYSVLITFKDFQEVKELYLSIIGPILNHDKDNRTSLLPTLISFVDSDGDFKKVSKELFQHENTIRYRIFKIRSILNMEKSQIEFFEKVSIGVKLYKIYNM